MKLGKKGKKLTTSVVQSAILALVIIVVLFGVYAAMVPEAQTAGDSLNDSNRCDDLGCSYNSSSDKCQYNSTFVGNATLFCSTPDKTIPLASLFGGNGIVFVILMAMLLIVIVVSLFKSAKGSK